MIIFAHFYMKDYKEYKRIYNTYSVDEDGNFVSASEDLDKFSEQK